MSIDESHAGEPGVVDLTAAVWSGAEAPLTVSTTEVPEGVRVAAVGELDISTASILRDPLQEALRAADAVVVDLTDVTFMDSHGLRVLIEARVAADEKSFVVAAASPNVRRLINLSGLGETFGLPAHH